MSLKLFACGDVINTVSKKNFIDNELKNIISNSDISICNFEAPIETNNMQPIKKAGPHVFQSKESISHLKYSGFNFVSLANNHIYDYGQEALKNTFSELKKYEIGYVGAGIDFNEAYSTKIIDKNGVKMGLIAACENEFGCLYENQNRGGYAWLFHYLIEDNIRILKEKVDNIVLIVHAGTEETVIPIKEWRDRYRRLCDVGVDVVVGHHPHVPQGYENYNNSMIFYSLGNFYFDTAGFKNISDDSYSLLLNFDKSRLKDFQIIYHKKIDGKVCKVNAKEVNFSLDELNNLLGKGYKVKNDELCLDLFNKYYYGYYESALGVLPKNATIIQTLKFIIKKLFFKNRNQENRNLMLLHNIRIDSHRFVVQRALKLMNEKG